MNNIPVAAVFDLDGTITQEMPVWIYLRVHEEAASKLLRRTNVSFQFNRIFHAPEKERLAQSEVSTDDYGWGP